MKRIDKQVFPLYPIKPSAGRICLNCPNEQRVSKKDGRKTDSSWRLNVVYSSFAFAQHHQLAKVECSLFGILFYEKWQEPIQPDIVSYCFCLSPSIIWARKPAISDETATFERRERWMGRDKATDGRNKTNGIVEQSQWNCWTKSMELAFENDGLACGNWRNDCFSPTISHFKSETFGNGKNWQSVIFGTLSSIFIASPVAYLVMDRHIKEEA